MASAVALTFCGVGFPWELVSNRLQENFVQALAAAEVVAA